MNKLLVMLSLCCCFLGLAGIPVAWGQKNAKLSDYPERVEIPALLAKLKDEDPLVKMKASERLAARALLRASDVKDAIGPWIEMMEKDEIAQVRMAAAKGLGMVALKPESVVPPLMKALKNDKNTGVKAAAAGALGGFGPDAKPAVSLLEEAVEETKDVAGNGKGKNLTPEDQQKLDLFKAASATLKIINGQPTKKK
jgi:HEAT repeat protein